MGFKYNRDGEDKEFTIKFPVPNLAGILLIIGIICLIWAGILLFNGR